MDCGLPIKGPKNTTVSQARSWSQYLISVRTALQAQCKWTAKCGQICSSISIWNHRQSYLKHCIKITLCFGRVGPHSLPWLQVNKNFELWISCNFRFNIWIFYLWVTWILPLLKVMLNTYHWEYPPGFSNIGVTDSSTCPTIDWVFRSLLGFLNELKAWLFPTVLCF